MKSHMTQLMAKHFSRGGFLVIGLLLVVNVLPPTFGRAGNSKKSARQNTSFHALELLNSKNFRELNWLEQKVTANDGAANDSLGWSTKAHASNRDPERCHPERSEGHHN